MDWKESWISQLYQRVENIQEFGSQLTRLHSNVPGLPLHLRIRLRIFLSVNRLNLGVERQKEYLLRPEKITQFFQSKYKLRNSLQTQLRLLKMIERCGLITRTTMGGLEIWGETKRRSIILFGSVGLGPCRMCLLKLCYLRYRNCFHPDDNTLFQQCPLNTVGLILWLWIIAA